MTTKRCTGWRSRGAEPHDTCITNFYADKHSKDGLQHKCKECHKLRNKEVNRGEYKKKYNEVTNKDPKYKGIRKVCGARRRAAQLQRTPSWANHKEIRKIYETCPEGYHVDHIIPLQGKNVSGLHVHTNLQHLKAEENLRKNNSYETGI